MLERGGIVINEQYFWDLESDRSLLRKLYHRNSGSCLEFSSVNLKPLRHKKRWNIHPEVKLELFPPESSFEQLLSRRRTRRQPSGKPIDLRTVARMLRFAAGITDPDNNRFSYPSPGALYPCTIFLSLSLPDYDHVYRYNPYSHGLELIAHDPDRRIDHVLLDPDLRQFGLKLFLASDYQLIEEKYGDLSYRLLCQETGHIAQNISLYAESIGLHSVCIGGFDERVFQNVVDPSYDLLYVMVVG